MICWQAAPTAILSRHAGMVVQVRSEGWLHEVHGIRLSARGGLDKIFILYAFSPWARIRQAPKQLRERTCPGIFPPAHLTRYSAGLQGSAACLGPISLLACSARYCQ